MYAQGVTKDDVISWAEKVLVDLNFTDYEISVTGKTEKGDGYLGEIVFLTAIGTTIKNGKSALDLVIKHGKTGEHLRKTTPVKHTFETEIYVYDKIQPAFRKFQLERGIKNVFDSVPKCYLTLIFDQMEVLIMENLRKNGYELHDRKKTLNFDHLKLILQEYGKWHALSFALKHQNVEEFNRLSKFPHNPLFEFMSEKSLKENMDNTCEEAVNVLRENGQEDLSKKFEDYFLGRKPSDLFLDASLVQEEQSVILHGDCWNNNFMFKYEDDDKASPSKVKMLDWQISALRSPVLDLSYFIYSNSSQKELERFDELMRIYHGSLSDFLKQLGSDPEQLFTFDDLRRHWKKYSIFGFAFTPMILKIALCNKEEAPALEDLTEGQDMGSAFNFAISDSEAYYERLNAVTRHYFEYEF